MMSINCDPECLCSSCNTKLSDPRAYRTRHAKVARNRGKASSYECVDCGRPAQEWSTVHGATDVTDVNQYEPRCIRCHRVYYDGISHWHEASLTPEAREKALKTRHDRYDDSRRLVKSESATRAWSRKTPEERSEIGQRIGIKLKGRKDSPETRQRKSEAQYRRWQAARDQGKTVDK